jgi:predicted CoA-binding protein
MTGYDEARIPEILKNSHNIAVVGISEKPERDSYRVAKYLKSHGYNVIPINPAIDQWDGTKSFHELASLPADLKVDIVDIFRKPEAAMEVVKSALKLQPKVVWMQEGVVNPEAADLARRNGIMVVMDRCIMKEHSRLSH